MPKSLNEMTEELRGLSDGLAVAGVLQEDETPAQWRGAKARAQATRVIDEALGARLDAGLAAIQESQAAQLQSLAATQQEQLGQVLRDAARAVEIALEVDKKVKPRQELSKELTAKLMPELKQYLMTEFDRLAGLHHVLEDQQRELQRQITALSSKKQAMGHLALLWIGSLCLAVLGTAALMSYRGEIVGFLQNLG